MKKNFFWLLLLSAIAHAQPAKPYIKVTRIDPRQITKGKSFTLYFTVTNNNPEKKFYNGVVQAYINNNNPVSSGKLLVPNNSAASGSVILIASNAGSATIHLSFVQSTYIVGRPKPIVQTIAETDYAININSDLVDIDKDGIDDHIEQVLLERYRPYFKFSKDKVDGNLTDEHYNPTDVLAYISESELLPSGDENDNAIIPNSVLKMYQGQVLSANVKNQGRFCTVSNGTIISCSSDLLSNRRQTEYHINPLESISGLPSNPGRHGSSWPAELQVKNIGLYGHVVRYQQNTSQGDFVKYADGNPKGMKPDLEYYKIEYWQFFGYNNANKAADAGDHEADWTTVQLLYDPRADTILSVFHYAHGDEIRFDFSCMSNPGCKIKFYSETDYFGASNSIKEYEGPNFGKSVFFGGSDPAGEAVALPKAQNHLIRMVRDPQSGQYTHPVVYIEYGSHEFWPSQFWDFYLAPAHDGNSYSFLTNTPPNLGEVENLLPEAWDRANVILRYNGKWGAYSHWPGDPPQGPPLHDQWTYPASSSVRWQLPKHLGH